jgi:hypothetical protein
MFNLTAYLEGLDPVLTVFFVLLLVAIVAAVIVSSVWATLFLVKCIFFGNEIKQVKEQIALKDEYEFLLERHEYESTLNPYILVTELFINTPGVITVNGVSFQSPVQPVRENILDVDFSFVEESEFGMMHDCGSFKENEKLHASSELDIAEERALFAKVSAEVRKETKRLSLTSESAKKLLDEKTSPVKKQIQLKESNVKSLSGSKTIGSIYVAKFTEVSQDITVNDSFVMNVKSNITYFYDKDVVTSEHGKKSRSHLRRTLNKVAEENIETTLVAVTKPQTQQEVQSSTIVEQTVDTQQLDASQESAPSVEPTQFKPTQESNIVQIDLESLEIEQQTAFQNQWEEEPQYG